MKKIFIFFLIISSIHSLYASSTNNTNSMKTHLSEALLSDCQTILETLQKCHQQTHRDKSGLASIPLQSPHFSPTACRKHWKEQNINPGISLITYNHEKNSADIAAITVKKLKSKN